MEDYKDWIPPVTKSTVSWFGHEGVAKRLRNDCPGKLELFWKVSCNEYGSSLKWRDEPVAWDLSSWCPFWISSFHGFTEIFEAAARIHLSFHQPSAGFPFGNIKGEYWIAELFLHDAHRGKSLHRYRSSFRLHLKSQFISKYTRQTVECATCCVWVWAGEFLLVYGRCFRFQQTCVGCRGHLMSVDRILCGN